ncbi:MAG: hypothetical protein PHR77_12780 [Kiritimatiellae bacterium]|nr:hypothetical protein [Kiritimatiellia bacterium]MDD5521690.1 hypothetical protein [Kiritimatiellia bacterium]
MSKESDILITTVNDEDRRMEFICLPWQIQQKDPAWVPPTISKQIDMHSIRLAGSQSTKEKRP